MKKLLISIFLMLSMVVSGLSSLQFTPVASAINKSAVRCDFLGQYINPNVSDRRCEPCPIDFYCPLVSGTQIENCAAKGFPDSDCKETRRIFSTDKAIPCPANTTTKGFTFNTLLGTRILENGDDLFPIVGQGATDKTMCQAPDFKCPVDKPVLLRTFDANGVAQEAKCFPTNTCAADQIAILKNGIPDCSVACKDQTFVNGKCYKDCPEGEFLEVISENKNGVKTQTVNCKKIIVIVKVCPIVGQAPTVVGDLSTCVCTAPQAVSADKTKCELPVIPCIAPLIGSQPNCVNPPKEQCPANQFGYSQPNCKPCPLNGTSPAGTVDSSGCVIPVIPCPANYYGVNGNVVCTPCPNGGTSAAGTTEIGKCVVPVVVVTPCPANYYGVNGNVLCTPCPSGQTAPAGTKVASDCKGQQGGGDGFCGGFWAFVCGAVVATTVDCFLTKVLCNKSQPSPTPSNTPTFSTPSTPTVQTNNETQYDIIKKTNSSSAQCSKSNESYISELRAYGKEFHRDTKDGKDYFWVYTVVDKSTNKTSFLSTTKDMSGNEVPALKCLMTRFYKKFYSNINGQFGGPEYMNELCGPRISKNGYNNVCSRVLHGRQLNRNSVGFDMECLDLTELLSLVGSFGEGEATANSVQYAVTVRGENTPVNGIWYNSLEELKAWISGNKVGNINIFNKFFGSLIAPVAASALWGDSTFFDGNVDSDISQNPTLLPASDVSQKMVTNYNQVQGSIESIAEGGDDIETIGTLESVTGVVNLKGDTTNDNWDSTSDWGGNTSDWNWDSADKGTFDDAFLTSSGWGSFNDNLFDGNTSSDNLGWGEADTGTFDDAFLTSSGWGSFNDNLFDGNTQSNDSNDDGIMVPSLWNE